MSRPLRLARASYSLLPFCRSLSVSRCFSVPLSSSLLPLTPQSTTAVSALIRPFTTSSASAPASFSSLFVSDLLLSLPVLPPPFLPSSLSLPDFLSYWTSHPHTKAIYLTDSNQHVVGMVDQATFLHQFLPSLLDSSSPFSLSSHSIAEFMKPARELIFVTPNDRLDAVITIVQRQNLDVLTIYDPDSKSIRGVLTCSAILKAAQPQLQSTDGTAAGSGTAPRASAKKEFLTEILPRLGLPSQIRGQSALNSTERAALDLECVGKGIPHFRKVETGGEDAHVLLRAGDLPASGSSSSPRSSLMAVFDGVGSWSFEKGIDCARFSRELAKQAEKVYREMYDSSASASQSQSVNPLEILRRCWNHVKELKIVGSATASVLLFNGQEIQLANLGDSGFFLLRPSSSASPSSRSEFSVVFRCPPQLHYFNCPYQLGIDEKGQTDRFDPVESAAEFTIPVREGDLLLLATDGLFDNVSEEEIVRIINENMSSQASTATLRHIVDVLVNRAEQLSRDRSVDSPFGLLAKENNIMWSGGRPDDITVLMARVKSAK